MRSGPDHQRDGLGGEIGGDLDMQSITILKLYVSEKCGITPGHLEVDCPPISDSLQNHLACARSIELVLFISMIFTFHKADNLL